MRLAALVLLLACGASAQVPNPEQLFREAVAAQQRGDDAVAIRKYQELLRLRPDVVEARANFGAVLARRERFDEAIEQYRAALARDEANSELRVNLALAYYKKGDLPAASTQLTMVHQAEPGNLRVALLLADCYARTKQDERVVALLKPLEAAHSDDLGLSWLLGTALIRTGRASDGLKRVVKVAKQGNSVEAYLLAGQTALKLNHFEQARDFADAAVRLDPRLPGLLTLRGMVLQYLGDNQGAIASLNKALESAPNDFDAHLTLGAVLTTERDIDGARRHLERALQLNPASNLARYELARVQRTQGELDAAVRNLEQVVRSDPNWAQPHVELAALYFRLKRPEEGQRERAIFDRLNAEQQKKENSPRSPTASPSR